MPRRVLIRKVDMDTCLTALILGVCHEDEIVPLHGSASDKDLLDPEVLCIEVGGSGQVHLNNFDHHNGEEREPACVQALKLKGGDEKLQRLVEYVAIIDTDPTGLPPTPSPTLSELFSGMLFLIPQPEAQLFKGMEIFSRVLSMGIDPFGTMPKLLEWEEYIRVKEEYKKRLKEEEGRVCVFYTRSGVKAGYLETPIIGALGMIYGLGCEVAVVYNPHFGVPPIPKFTISARGRRISHLLPILNQLEPGWGGPGHGTIIGSPCTGTRLSPEEVLRIVRENV